MPSRENFTLILSLIIFIGMVARLALDEPVSEAFWINAIYISGLFLAAILMFIFIFPLLTRLLRANDAGLIAIAVLIFLSVAFIDRFWLHEWVSDLI